MGSMHSLGFAHFVALAIGVGGCGRTRTRDAGPPRGTAVYGGLTEPGSGSVLRIDRFQSSGALGTHDVETVLALTGHTVWPCFDPIAQAAEGTVVVRWGVNDRGAVTDVSIEPSPVAPPAIAACLDRAVRSFSFPPSGGPSRVTWTVSLERGN